MIGRGSNILFTDQGFRGLIVKNFTKSVRVEGNTIIADSGVLLGQIIRLSIDHNLVGLEPFYGLPGSMGGALYGNAGIPDTEIGRFVKSATIFNVSEGVREVPAQEISFGYRQTSLQQKHELILSVTLELESGEGQKSKELLKKIGDTRYLHKSQDGQILRIWELLKKQ